jgi:hypothetical protein
MGDWCVPAGHDNQVNEDRDAYHGQALPMRRIQAFGPTGPESPGEILSLDKRGLMGVPFSDSFSDPGRRDLVADGVVGVVIRNSGIHKQWSSFSAALLPLRHISRDGAAIARTARN